MKPLSVALVLCFLIGNAAAAVYPLDSINPALIEQDWGQAGINRAVDGGPLVMGGKTFAKGIGTHANGTIELTLDGKATEFTAMVGASDRQQGTAAKVAFAVLGDGKELWASGPLTPGQPAKSVKVNLAGVKRLALNVTDGGNGNSYDHANWADAVISYTGAAPQPGGAAIALTTAHFQWNLTVRKRGVLELSGIQTRDGNWTAPFRGPAWPGASECKYHDAPVAIQQANGDTALKLVYESHSSATEAPGIEHVTIVLRDEVNPLQVELHYRVFAREDVVEQWALVRNGGKTPIRVTRLDSAFWQAPAACNAHLEWYDSRWAGEAAAPLRERLAKGRRLLESRGGNRHIEGVVPAFVMGFGGFPDEDKTPCLIAALAWSGSVRMSFDSDHEGQLASSIGVNPDAGAVTLDPGQALTAPACLQAFSPAGKGPASRNLHAWMRRYGMRDGDRPRLIDNNSWEGCFFDVSEPKVLDMMKGSAELGIELYVLDDGWFGNGPTARTGDAAGLGDWQPNRERFPNGLDKLVKGGKDLGIAFGLWFEPEMINPRSELMAAHPDWVLRHPNRELVLQRNQAVLDLANPAVQNFVFRSVDDILTANPGIRFVKWDANSDINNPFSPYLKADRQGDLLHRYLAGYYSVLDKLVGKHPAVDFQACSSGGGRADLGAMKSSHTFWVSDNTDPLYRLNAQWNFTTFLAPLAMTCHVTHAGQFQPKFRFDVSMMGQLGMEIDPRKSEPEYQAAAKTGIAAYKGVRDIVQFGSQYRHAAPADSPTPSLTYVAADRGRALVLAYQTGPADGQVAVTAPVAGLDPARSYVLTEINLPPGDASPRVKPGAATRTGAEWMRDGVPLVFTRRHDSAALTLDVAR